MKYMSVAEAAKKWGVTGQDVFILGLRQFGHAKLAEKAEADRAEGK